MSKQLPELNIPVLYVNPPLNGDAALVEEVSRAGGLGIVDHATAGPAPFSVATDVPYGVRIGLAELPDFSADANVKLVVLPLTDAAGLAGLEPAALATYPLPILAEVATQEDAEHARAAGASGLVARGYEGAGWVSETCGFVLLQRLLNTCDLPVFLQGGVGLHTAAGARAAGAAGVVLDVHLLFAERSAVEHSLKDFLSGLGFPTTETLAESTGMPLRVYSRAGTKAVRQLRKAGDALKPEDHASYREQLAAAMRERLEALDSGDALLPLSEDLNTAKNLCSEHLTAGEIVAVFGRMMAGCTAHWPFVADSELCRKHRTRFPVVQGPMAHVSDNPHFLAAVAAGGALPFLAMGNMPAPIAAEAIRLAREQTGGNFGVGLIGLDINGKCYEAHLALMRETPPPFAILAAGGVELAKRIEEQGTTCYLHCPAPSMLAEALKAGLRHFVFEGCESGGHIGAFGSLDLWSANLNELQAAASSGIPLAEVSVLFAGGIASGRATAFLGGMVGGLAAKGLHVGLQMGTAYLTTREAVDTCAITSTYQELTVESQKTVVIGRTVNIRARAAGSPAAATLIEREQQRLREGVPLRERKELYETDNLGSLRLAAKGCAIDPSTATWDCPVFCDLTTEDQLTRGLYLMGQAVSLLEKPCTVEELHAEILDGGRRIFEEIAKSAQQEAEALIDREEIATDVEAELRKEPIAVIGIGLRFPGSDSTESYWEQIVSGRSGIVDVPPDRWGNPEFFYDPDPKSPDKTYSRIGGFITDFCFEPLKYRIPPAVAKKMDRTQHFAVTCVADALADAGLSPEQLKGKRVGIVLGNSMGGETTDRYAERLGLPRTVACLEQSLASLNLDDDARAAFVSRFQADYLTNLPEITEDSLPGELANVISGRVANVFNIEGPNFTVDAACASSMAAVMNAAAALREGQIDCAITGGVDAAMHPSSFVKFCKVGALSPDGSRPFDEGANGFVMGEGAGVMILKRLSDALRDGDRIYATILDIGSSSDGRGKGITAPNAAGQERAIKACLESSGVDPASIGLIEAHGTSTPVGDKTELTVLDSFFRATGRPKGSVAIGSVKSQVGHLKAAAGAAGMIKAVLSLHHRTLPPTINVRRPNPCIEWDSSPLFLVTEPRPWETSALTPRRAGVSAFGFGGTNFHVLFQEHVPGLRVVPTKKRAETPVPFVPPNWPRPPKLEIRGEAWVLGGRDADDLGRKIGEILRELTPANAARLVARHREEAAQYEIRCGFSAPDATVATQKLTVLADAIANPAKRAILPTRGIHVVVGPPKKVRAGVAFLFPGQGSQYPFMLRDLAERFPIVASTIREADEVLTSLGLPGVTEGMFPGEGGMTALAADGDTMRDTQFLQPMILAANTAIFRLLALVGVKPAACAGHSLGEYAACVAAGVFSFRDALEAVAVRGREMARVSIADPGLMMSISADARVVEEVLAEVDGYVVAANKNSPKQTVISGETPAVRMAGELFKARGLDGVLLPVSAAFHSGVVAPAREPFMRTLERLTMNPPLVPVLSNVTGDFYPIGPAAPEHIRDLLGKQFAAPVEWVKSLRRLHSEGIRIFVECGPKRVLTNLTLDTLPQAEVLALPSNHPKKGGIGQLMEALAALAAEGVPVDFSRAEEMDDAPARAVPARRPELKVVPEVRPVEIHAEMPAAAKAHPLEALIDPELEEISRDREFAKYMEMQGEPIRALIKSGFQSFVKNVLPLEKTVRQVKSEGMDFRPVVVSGLAAGLPSDVRFPFDRETLDDLVLGRNFIKKVGEGTQSDMLEKNVERLVKGPSGEAELKVVDDISGVLKLAGFFSEEEVITEYGLDDRIVRAMDVTSRLAVAAGIEALRDAGIPLVQMTRKTSTGTELPDGWALPPSLRQETGIIFASAFPGMASLVDEVTRETAARYGAGAKKRLIEFYTGLVSRITDDRERERLTTWFSREFGNLNPGESEDLYSFNRDFLLKVMSMAHGQLAQLIKAQGPNTHLDAACAGTTQAMVMARDWIRTGRAKRVILVAADDVAGKTLFPWIGSGFLAMGAATTTGNVSEAALPFDDRRHGLILGSAAAGVVVESLDTVQGRGVEPIASIEAAAVANSAYHGTRLDVDHISSVMNLMIARWEEQTGLTRADLAQDVFFMSHETYSPKRGGSSAAEIRALRDTFGDNARAIPIANTKGLTGHTMGVGVEDVVALRCLQKQMLPPIANLRQPDPEFADMNLSKGGVCKANYALRLAAGFGSQVVMALYKGLSHEENRIVDLHTHRKWLQEITGYHDPVISVEQRTLRVAERSARQGVEPAKVTVAPSAPESTVALAAISVEMSASGGSATANEVREKILALLGEKTGYPAEMLDTGLDLEADLGIDTVKQAEFISEVREAYGIPRIEGLKIADFPTIEHIINFVLQHVGKSTTNQPDSEAGAAPSQPAAGDQMQVREKILALLSEKTGYPADMLDTGLDLEADLGIDTVKQAEFIAEVREIFDIPRIEGLKIADFPTIDHIIQFVIERRRDSAPPEAHVESQDKPSDSAGDAEADAHLFDARLVELALIEKIAPPQADETVIVGGPADFADAVAEVMRQIGSPSVRLISEGILPEELREKRVGIVNLVPLEDSGSALDRTLELYLSCAAMFGHGPSFLVTVVSEDGAYGFENPSVDGYISGCVAGATKGFGREYPESRTCVLDVHPSLRTEEVAAVIGRSITEAFPLETAVGANGGLRAVRFVPLLDTESQPCLASGDVVLISGGARGITAECVRALAERQPLTLVILGRTSLSGRAEQLSSFTREQWNEEKKRIIERLKRDGKPPTPMMVEKELGRLQGEAEVYRNLRAFKATGSEVMYRGLDIRDDQAVDRVIQEVAETCGRIDLVIHAAGIDVSRALRSKTLEQMQAVISVKVMGMRNLLSSMERHGMTPRRVVGFGSVSGRFGNMAQVDYSSANDGLAHLLRRVGSGGEIRASIMDWAPWAEIGMATRGSVQQTLEAAGIDFVSPKKGTELFLLELDRPWSSSEVLAAGRVGPFADDAFHLPGVPMEQGVTFAGQESEVISILPGHYVRVRVQLDPFRPVLNDHRIDRAAVFPGVGGMEVMRAAATLLNRDAQQASFEEIRFRSPLKVFKDEPFEVEVEAFNVQGASDEPPTYYCRIVSWFRDKEGRIVGAPRLHHECRVTLSLGDSRPDADFGAWSRSVWVADEEIYALFFHGPAFKLLPDCRIEAEGKGVRFHYRDTTERPEMFTDHVPAAVEAVFQAGAAFGVQARGIMALPTGVDRVTVLDANAVPHDGQLLVVGERALTGPEARRVMRFDAAVRDADGRTVLSLEGVEMVELRAESAFSGRVFEEMVQVADIVGQTKRSGGTFLADYLSKDEAEEHAAKATRKRADEWLAGRVALKRTVQHFLQGKDGSAPAASDIRIVQDDLGKPMAELSRKPGARVCDVSLSHSNGLALAVASAPGVFPGLGVDVEKIENRSSAWVEDYFTEEEIRAAGEDDTRWVTLTGMWGLKEAVLKALGTGLRFDLRDIEVSRVAATGRVALRFRNEAAAHIGQESLDKIDARVEHQDGLIIARALIRQ
ncbi:MAG: SDR family NAD(P)-dependent oxidoreductase [Desulfomonile tiedjei]|nr:SDR family NAD(P)-dependent oxidoreductase [Desulfomonile tiedjei]